MKGKREMRHRGAIGLAAMFVLTVGFARNESTAREEGPEFKAVVHVNFDEPGHQKAALKNVANMLKEAGSGRIEVVCHGKGLGLLVKAQTPHAAEIERLARAGVKFAACENSMREKSVAKADLLPVVETVPSGAVEIVRKQQEGHGYFKP